MNEFSSYPRLIMVISPLHIPAAHTCSQKRGLLGPSPPLPLSEASQAYDAGASGSYGSANGYPQGEGDGTVAAEQVTGEETCSSGRGCTERALSLAPNRLPTSFMNPCSSKQFLTSLTIPHITDNRITILVSPTSAAEQKQWHRLSSAPEFNMERRPRNRSASLVNFEKEKDQRSVRE